MELYASSVQSIPFQEELQIELVLTAQLVPMRMVVPLRVLHVQLDAQLAATVPIPA
jgi:hypothetical protein